MEDLGYETHNSILNLGSLFIFGTIYVIKVVIYLVGRIFQRFSGIKIKGLKKFGQKLFFGELLAIVLEAYFEWMIAGYLNYEA